MFADSLVHPVLIVGAVSREGCDRVSDLVEQHTGQRGVIDLFSAQLNCSDPATFGIMPMCSLRQDRRREVPCFSTSHSPAPWSFSPVLSTRRCNGPVPHRRSGGMLSVLLRRLIAEWSGTLRSRPSRAIMEPMSPSA